MRERLEQRLESSCSELARLDERLRAKGDYGHGKGDPLVVGWELDLARRQKVEEEIRQIEAALTRIDQGEYGICRACHSAIDPERIEALPYTTLCITCARSGKHELAV
jgi:RNA polymerase-binding transcription factor DksA